MTKRIGVLLSGRGSNLQALIDAGRAGHLGGEIGVVLSNIEAAQGLDRARRAGIPAVFRDHRGRTREEFDADVAAILKQHEVQLVCLAGYMRLVSPAFLRAFPDRVLNVHPSLLPAFPGLEAQRQAWEYGVQVSGATVHLVDEGLDTGPILLQETVPVLPGEGLGELSARILDAEHRIYPTAVRTLLAGRYRIEGRRAVVEAA